MTGLSATQRSAFHEQGYVVLPGFADKTTTEGMLGAARELAGRFEDHSAPTHDALLQAEAAIDATRPLAERTSKIFRVHRHEQIFRDFVSAPGTTRLVADLLGPDLDCFLSQFIFKQPDALGQPWHQDAFYFPFEGPFQLGLWLAVTAARLDNGPLWVLPGSHVEPVHAAVKDTREHANRGYFEIVDHDMSNAIPVLLEAGDLLLFHSHLMHKSTDNRSCDLRAAMVYHYATADTIDNSESVYGSRPANQDWLPVLRHGKGV